MLLEIENLYVNYRKGQALKGVSLNIKKGEIVTIIGANGAGKTTILRTISGFKKPFSGEIRFQNKMINNLAPHQIVKLGITHILAGRAVFAPMSVEDNLNVGAYLRKDKKKVSKDLERMYSHFPRLKERKNQLAGSMSGGEQQMLAIGRALMSNPKLLLMDEPSSGLSPLVCLEVANIIKEINQGGISIILVEQNARMALKLANRAYILELGKITMEGNAEEMLNDEQIKYAYLGTKSSSNQRPSVAST